MNSILSFLDKNKIFYEVNENKIIIKVWAKPGQKIQKYSVSDSGELILFIKEKAIDGKANDRFVDFLKDLLKVRKKDIQLKRGHKSKHKTFEVFI